MEIRRYPYRVSYSDWVSAIRLARWRTPKTAFRFVLAQIVPSAGVCLIAALLWDLMHQQKIKPDDLYSIAVILGLVTAIYAARAYGLRRRYRRSAMNLFKEDRVLAYNEHFLVSGQPGHGEGRFLWNALYDVAENDHVFLIYTSKYFFLVLPKIAVPVEALEELRNLVPNRKGIPC